MLNCTNKYLARGFCSTHYKSEIYTKERPLYHLWQTMIARCHREWSSAYHYYGARGISVCERWHDFKNFEEDVSPRPTPEHTLDRIDNDGDYEPDNVRWATAKEQRANSRPQKIRVDNKYGHTGIRRLKNGRWSARYGEGGRVHLGTFDTKEEAILAREEAK